MHKLFILSFFEIKPKIDYHRVPTHRRRAALIGNIFDDPLPNLNQNFGMTSHI